MNQIFTNMSDSAANSLEGLTLTNGWTVTKKIDPGPNSTGGNFSVGYHVQKGDKMAFLKAIDVVKFFSMFPGNLMVRLKEMTDAYVFERDLLLLCKGKKLSKVASILDEGEINVSGFSFPDVPYLIFELADGDARSKLEFAKKFDVAWKLRSLHNVTVGITQLHGIEVSHQDLKPSNVLVYDGIISKIGDLGRSLCKTLDSPHSDLAFAGQVSYAPPEMLYNYIEPDWNKRVYTTDAYLLGSLVVFYFSGVNMTALIRNHIEPRFNWQNWKGTYEDVKPYLVEAFGKALDTFCNDIDDKKLASELCTIVEQLCFPDPNLRGHPLDRNKVNALFINRYINIFNRLAKTAENGFNFK